MRLSLILTRSSGRYRCIPAALLLSLSLAAQVDLQIEPNPVLVGEDAELVLVAKRGTARLAGLPTVPRLIWLSKTPVVDGSRVRYSFRISRPGRLQLPDQEVLYGGDTILIRPPPIEVQAPDVPSDAIQLKLTWDGEPSPPERVFAGQMLELTVQLEVLEGEGYQVHDALFEQYLMPTWELPDVEFRNYPGQNKYSRRFFFTSGRRREGKQTVRRYSYRCAVMRSTAGELRGRFVHELPLILTASDPANDFMKTWHPPPQRVIWWPLELALPPIPVLPLPPPPDTPAVQTGLVGDFRLSMDVSAPSVRVGDGIFLELRCTGPGNIEALAASELTLPGFKVYPPQRQVSGMNREGELRWLVVPIAAESQLPVLVFRHFSLPDEAWRFAQFQPQIEILPGGLETADPRFVSELRLPQSSSAPEFQPWLAVFWVFGPVGFLLLFWLRRRLAARRRPRWQQELAKLCRSIQQSTDLSVTTSGQVLPFLRRFADLPPGSTPEEIAAEIDDPEFTAVLLELARGSFRPGDRPEIKADQLIRHLRRHVSVLLLLLTPLLLGGTRVSEGGLTNAVQNYRQNRYFAAAADLQPLWEQSGGRDPNLAFNLGNCAFMARDYARALLWYERALRLAPRDEQIRRNRRLARMKLGLPPPAFAPIDWLRPAEWLVLATGAWFLAWLGFALAGWFRKSGRGILLAFFLLCGVGLGCRSYQLQHSYHPDLALVLEDTAIYRLPDVPLSTPINLTPGSRVMILERRDQWQRVRSDSGQGWIPQGSAARLRQEAGMPTGPSAE